MKTFDQEKDVVYTFNTTNEFISDGYAAVLNYNFLGTGEFAEEQLYQVTPCKIVKTYNHWRSGSLSGGYYQTVFDRSYAEPNSVAAYDITVGSSVSSSFNGVNSAGSKFVKQKNKIYRQMAQQLLGHPDKFFEFGNRQCHDVFFVLYKRNQYKDKIKFDKSYTTTNHIFCFSGNIKSFLGRQTLSNNKSTAAEQTTRGSTSEIVPGYFAPPAIVPSSSFSYGKVFYEHGIFAFDLLNMSSTASTGGNNWFMSGTITASFTEVYKTNTAGMTLDSVFDAARSRLVNVNFANEMKTRNTFYTCVAEKEEFNYSSNPTFVKQDGSIVTTSGSASPGKPITFITRVALLGVNNEVLAQGTLSRPIRKDFNTKVTIKVRLDF